MDNERRELRCREVAERAVRFFGDRRGWLARVFRPGFDERVTCGLGPFPWWSSLRIPS